MKKETKVTEKTAKNSKYQELNDSELEVVCGGVRHIAEADNLGNGK